jgi:phosphomannomutase
MTIKFGTDGWRAVISEDFTFTNLRLVARAIGRYLGESKDSLAAPVVVGFDTRFLSDRYALETSRCLAEEGLNIHLSKADCPTPALAHAIRFFGALGGVMITASHNPPRYNGVKFKASHGGPAMPEETQRIEELLIGIARNGTEQKPASALADLHKDYPSITRFDPMPAYLHQVSSLVDLEAIRTSGLRVAVDPMYGAGRGYLAELLEGGRTTADELHGEMNPGFGGIHPEPIERNLGELCAVMRSGEYDIGLATDGDADRIGAVDACGNFVDPHRIFSLVLRHLVERRGGRGAVVKTVSTTQLVNRLSQHYNLPLHETPVGFNHICSWMLKEDVLMGGEESGGMTIKGHVPDGDGLLIGLLLLELMAVERRPLHELVQDLMGTFGTFHYGRSDVRTSAFDKMELTHRLTAEAPLEILDLPVRSVNNSDGVKYLLADDSWLLIRPSGTEPVLRIYAEAPSVEQVRLLLAAGAQLAHV